MSSQRSLIRQSFNAAKRYDRFAKPQEMIAERLSDITQEKYLKQTPKKILEIGCGTGFLSQRLVSAYPQSSFLFTDISPDMLQRCQEKLGNGFKYAEMDGEAPNTKEKFDLIISNMTFQWFENLRESLQKLKSLLTPTGQIIFSIVADGTFVEWIKAHEKIGASHGVRSFVKAEDLKGADIQKETFRTEYENIEAFVRHLKCIGANTPQMHYQPLSTEERRALKSICEKDGKPHFSYNIIFARIQNK